MTAVLQATDAFSRFGPSMDDSHINYTGRSMDDNSTDWKSKYNEVHNLLLDTRTELDDFHHSSKELEEELERELERTEKSQADLKVKAARAESERDDWKTKFMSLQTNHNTTTTSLQRELDRLRQEYQIVKIQLRELETGNDDLERNERAVSSSLADVEGKYSRALEEKIMLEHELLDKASLEEESQRYKDELRDAAVEISILKDQLAAALVPSSPAPSFSSNKPASSAFPHIVSNDSDEDLLSTRAPPDLQLSELSTPSEGSYSSSDVPATPRPQSLHSAKGQSALLHRAGFQPGKSHISTPPGSLARSSTLPTLATPPSRIPPRTPTIRTPVARITSSASTVVPTTSKNKGVQMVSEMRMRVRQLEQKIHTRVPRLRMGSTTARPNPLAASTMSPINSSMSSTTRSTAPAVRTPVDERGARRGSGEEKKKTAGDTSGWVLIMEDSPSPVRNPDKEKRRLSSDFAAPTAFRPLSSISRPPSSTGGPSPSPRPVPLFQSTAGLRRPQSRLSAASLSTTATSNSIPTPASRPTTPTFLPLPTGSAGLYSHNGPAGATGLGKSTGPGSSYANQAKRTSLGASTAGRTPGLPRERPTTMPPLSGRPRPNTPSSTSSSSSRHAGLPSTRNVTVRSSKAPSPGLPSVLSQSRIGRPGAGISSGRRSTGPDSLGSDTSFLEFAASSGRKDGTTTNRPRAGSQNALSRYG